ncbi:class I tRNA ligase family protein [Paucibacter sp. O1-1]|nr:class I tRNA ligase family protein [Paucibacter sp. O1-1]MDA3827949.1 class I tRNA ligase family protein [Paucibacter sp. O1-1]
MLWIVGLDKAAKLQKELDTAYNEYQFHAVKIQNFCSVELGGFYLDIVKDRQYHTTQENSLARRSAQTALYHIVEAFAHGIAPVLSFTADELGSHYQEKERVLSFLGNLHEGLTELPEDAEYGTYSGQLFSWQKELVIAA